jgi:hypothetical protein
MTADRLKISRSFLSLLILVCIHITGAFSQVSDPNTFSSSGGHIIGQFGQLSWTLGESFASVLTAPSGMVTEGYQQPDLPQSVIVDVQLTGFASPIIYPNPASEYIIIEFPQTFGGLKIRIYSSAGQIVYEDVRVDLEDRIIADVSRFPAGVYIAEVFDGKKNFDFFKFSIIR